MTTPPPFDPSAWERQRAEAVRQDRRRLFTLLLAVCAVSFLVGMVVVFLEAVVGLG